MTDKIRYTVTMEVETDAVGPAQAIRQALDWAQNTQSGPGVVTVRAGDLSPLRAAVADGRVAQLFTGPVTTPGPIMWQPKPAGVDPDKLRALVSKWRHVARNLGLVNIAFDPAKAARLGGAASRLQQCAGELEELTDDH